MCYDCSPLMKALDAYIAKADDELIGALDDAGFIDAENTVSGISSLEDNVANALKQETSRITRAASEAVDLETFAADIWPELKIEDNVDEVLQTIFTGEFTRLMPALAAQYAAQIDSAIVVTQITNRTTAWVTSWSEELGQIMKLTSHTEIEKILVNGLKEGKGVAAFTQDILDSGIRDEYTRARRVALTETLRAHSYAKEEAITQSPAAESKEWVHTGAYRNKPRENHVALSGVVVPKNETFTLEGYDGKTYTPRFPRDTDLPPSESVSCHCIHRGIASEKILGLPLEERKRLQAEAIAADNDDWEKELNARNRAKADIDPDLTNDYDFMRAPI